MAPQVLPGETALGHDGLGAHMMGGRSLSWSLSTTRLIIFALVPFASISSHFASVCSPQGSMPASRRHTGSNSSVSVSLIRIDAVV